jgi:putative Mn2+ efflux pump MntP
MPMIGWVLIHTLVEQFRSFEKFIPWIALALLSFIGGKMLYEGIKGEGDEGEAKPLSLSLLIAQGIATSIDALSVGFTISKYTFVPALVNALIIALVTFAICIAGVKIGNKVGEKFSGKASIFGGAILIFIGLEIFITSFF